MTLANTTTPGIAPIPTAAIGNICLLSTKLRMFAYSPKLIKRALPEKPGNTIDPAARNPQTASHKRYCISKELAPMFSIEDFSPPKKDTDITNKTAIMARPDFFSDALILSPKLITKGIEPAIKPRKNEYVY